MTEAIIAALPLIASVVVPPLFALVRKIAADKIPSAVIPLLLPIAGGIVGWVANLMGVDATILKDYSDVNAWQTVITGVLVGAASVGIHQIGKQKDKSAKAD